MDGCGQGAVRDHDQLDFSALTDATHPPTLPPSLPPTYPSLPRSLPSPGISRKCYRMQCGSLERTQMFFDRLPLLHAHVACLRFINMPTRDLFFQCTSRTSHWQTCVFATLMRYPFCLLVRCWFTAGIAHKLVYWKSLLSITGPLLDQCCWLTA